MSKVIVMIEDDDGRRDWWEIFHVEDVGYTFLPPGDQGARADLTVRGSFYRRSTDDKSRKISAQMRAALEGDVHGELPQDGIR